MTKRIVLVRTLRTATMEFGMGIDSEGRRWAGFFAQHGPFEVLYSGELATVGLCCCCGDRVYRGWECLDVAPDTRLDACPYCVELPQPSMQFIVSGQISAETIRLFVTQPDLMGKTTARTKKKR